MRKIYFFLISILTLFFIWIAFTNLTTYLTVDEEIWMQRSLGFFNGITHGIWADTYQARDPGQTHPGVTLMYSEQIAIIFTKILTFTFFRDHKEDFFFLFRAMRFMSILTTITFLTSAVYLLHSLLKKVFKESAVVFLIFTIIFLLEPFFLGTLKRIHLDAMVGAGSVLSLVILSYYLTYGKKKYLLSYFAAITITILTKVTGAIVVPFSAGMVLLKTIFDNKFTVKNIIFSIKKSFMFGIYVGIFFLLLSFIVWPVMWVNPYYAMISLFGAVSNNLTTPHDANLEYTIDVTYYIRALYTFTSPVFIASSIVTIFYFIWNIKKLTDKKYFSFAIMFLFTLFFLVITTIVAKKGERYFVPGFLTLALANAFVLWRISIWFQKRKNSFVQFIVPTATVIIAAFSMYNAYLVNPYFIAYYSTLTSQERLSNLKVGLGEGLELAADHINKLEPKRNIIVGAWYDSMYIKYANKNQQIVDIKTFLDPVENKKIDYIVTYRNMYGRDESHPASQILKIVENKKPEKVFYINGLPYVWIYKN